MKVSDYIADFLQAQGVHHVFLVTGGMLTHIVDSIYRQGKIELINTHHEQAAAFAAEAEGRITGVPGVGMATSGPGATNLLTGIGSCYFDSSPAVFITGQVNRDEQKKSLPVRQLGFQETDIVSMAKPITKAAWQASTPDEVPDLLKKAFLLATSGRPGPVLLDIPMDIQRSQCSFKVPVAVSAKPDPGLEPGAVKELLDRLAEAKHPLVLAGGGIRSSQATDLFRTLVDQIKVPVVNSLMAVDALAYANPLRIGLIGTYGNRWANMAIGMSDFIIVMGSRLDIRQTGADVNAFKGNRTIYHVDCDAAEINNRVKGCRPIVAQLPDFISTAIKLSGSCKLPDWSDWLIELNNLRNKWPDIAELKGIKGINPNEFMHRLSAVSQAAKAFVADVGQHQMWAAQSLELGPDQRFLTSGGMGAMGFALPASIGVTLSCSKQSVVMIAGDGSFQLNIQELETVKKNNIPIKMIIINNECYGMVRQFQQSYFEERYPATYWDYSAPDFVRVAEAYGIPGFTVRKTSEIEKALFRLWKDPGEPTVLQVMVDAFTNVYPKIAFGLPITEMEPLAKPVDMEGT
jgi:acetolactate synthase-1/2/3 large subunit